MERQSSFSDQITKQKVCCRSGKNAPCQPRAVTSTFSDACTALLLFLTLPVTVATSEHSFSISKLIKNHLRSTEGQGRLSGLAMFSIENERAKKMDIQSTVDEFAERKARPMPFKYSTSY